MNLVKMASDLPKLDGSRSRKVLDMEAGKKEDDEVLNLDPFDIANTKNASVETLKRWRQAALVLNASRRFRYTLDLKKEEEKDSRRRMIRAHAQVIRAALLFKLAGEQAIGYSDADWACCFDTRRSTTG